MSAPAATPEAFIGLFITTEKHRGKGIGSYIFSLVMNLLGDRNVVLDSLVNATMFYTSRGFHQTGMVQYSVAGTPTPIPKSQLATDITVEHVTGDNIDDMVNYESSICVVERSKFIKAWAKRGDAYMARRDGKVCGICVVWKYKPDRYRLAAFYADDIEIAKSILSRIITDLTGRGSLLLYFPHDNLNNASQLLDVFSIAFDKKIDNICFQYL